LCKARYQIFDFIYWQGLVVKESAS